MIKIVERVDGSRAVTSAETMVIKCDGTRESVRREIAREHRLKLVVNEQTVARLVCTPNELDAFVVGRLITEKIIASVDDIDQLYLCDSGNRARVFLKKEVKFSGKKAEEPTCCTDNRVLMQPERMDEYSHMEAPAWKPEWIFNLADAFARDSGLHKSTGATHSCVLAVEGRIVHTAEDIGRHNAMDKVIGYAAMQGLEPGKCILFTTGRIPSDMVRKALAAGIPMLVSKSVPTKEAVELAAQYGLTLICRAWPDSFEVFC